MILAASGSTDLVLPPHKMFLSEIIPKYSLRIFAPQHSYFSYVCRFPLLMSVVTQNLLQMFRTISVRCLRFLGLSIGGSREVRACVSSLYFSSSA